MNRHLEQYSFPGDEMIDGSISRKRTCKNPEYRYALEQKKKHRKAIKQRKKASIQLRNRIRNRNDHFIRSWVPEKPVEN